jgi:hypothetical protein
VEKAHRGIAVFREDDSAALESGLIVVAGRDTLDAAIGP